MELEKKVDKRSKEYKESVKVESTKAPEIDRIFFLVDTAVIMNGKHKRVRMIAHQIWDSIEFTDDGWLVVQSKGMTRIPVTAIASVLYK